MGLSKLEQNIRRDDVELLDSDYILYKGRWLILITIVLVRLYFLVLFIIIASNIVNGNLV